MISVIIDVYNGEKYIKKCLDSIINQTYRDLDILIVNDGSTDNTLKILKSYKDKRIRIINQSNKGLSISRNVGIENALGDYLYFIDVDDFIDKDTIDYLYKLIIKYNASIATCKCMDIFDYDFKKKDCEEKIELLSNEEMLKKVLLSTNREVAIWNKLIKKELFDNERFETGLVDDILFTHRIVNNAQLTVYSNQIKYYYLNRNDSLSHVSNKTIDTVKAVYFAYIKRYNEIKKLYPNMVENEASVLWYIPRQYLIKNKNIQQFLKDNKVKKYYNSLYSFKVLKCNIGIKEKIKMVLFRISPFLHNIVMNLYIRIVVRKK